MALEVIGIEGQVTAGGAARGPATTTGIRNGTAYVAAAEPAGTDTTFQAGDIVVYLHSHESRRTAVTAPATGNKHVGANHSVNISINGGTASSMLDIGYVRGGNATSQSSGAWAFTLPTGQTLQDIVVSHTFSNQPGTDGNHGRSHRLLVVRGAEDDFGSNLALGAVVSNSSTAAIPDQDPVEWEQPSSILWTNTNYDSGVGVIWFASYRRDSTGVDPTQNPGGTITRPTTTDFTGTSAGTGDGGFMTNVTQGRGHAAITYFQMGFLNHAAINGAWANGNTYGFVVADGDTNGGAGLGIFFREASTGTVETASVTGSYSVQNSDSVQGDYGVQTSSPVTASYSVQVSTPVTASYSVEVSAPVSGSYSVQASASVSASYSVEVSTEVTASYSVQVSTPVSSSYSVQVSTPVSADYSVQTTLSNQVVANYGLKSSTEVQSDYSVLVEESVSADYFVETTPTAQVAADYGVQSSTNVQSDYGVRVEKSVSSSYDVQSSAAESTQVSASYALQVSDDVQADYGVKVSSEVAASYGLQLSPDVTAGYSVQRILSDQVDSDYAVRNSSPVSASYSLTFSRDVLGDYAVQSESTVQSDYAIANSTEIGASYVVDDGITNASVTLLDSIPIQSVGTAQTTLSFSAIGQSQFAGQSLVIALVGVGEFRNSSNQNWNVNYPFFSHSPSMDEVTNTLSTNTTAPEFVQTALNFALSENFCYLAYRQIQASDTFKTYDVTVDIPYNSTGNFVGGVLLRVNNGVVPSSWPKHRHQTSLIQGISYTTPAQNYDANSLILTLVGFHDDESGGVVTPEKGIEELYQSNVVNKGGQTSPRGLIAEEPVGNSALTNRSQVFTIPTGLAPPSVQILSFNFEIQAGETQTQQVSAEYVVQGASTTSVITGSYGVGGTDTATATYSVQSTDTVAVGSDYAVKPEAAVSADYAVTTSDQVAGDYALQVQQPVSGSYGVTNSEEVDGDYAVLNSRIVTSNYLVATENVEFASVTASYGVTAETEVSATYGVGQSAQVDADYAVMNEPFVSADYGVQVQSPVSASYALQATESVGATFSVQNTQAVESDYTVKNSEQVTGEYLVQQLDVQGQVSASYDVGVPQIRNIGASYAVSGQITVNQETVLGEYVVRNDAYVAEKALRQLGYLKQRTK